MKNYIRGRQQVGQNPKPAMKPEDKEKMINESMAVLQVQFHNQTRPLKFWSKCGQRKHRNINEAINHLMWMVSGYDKWKGTIHSAAIFDTREVKTSGSYNKVYQFENNRWELDPNFNL